MRHRNHVQLFCSTPDESPGLVRRLKSTDAYRSLIEVSWKTNSMLMSSEEQLSQIGEIGAWIRAITLTSQTPIDRPMQLQHGEVTPSCPRETERHALHRCVPFQQQIPVGCDGDNPGLHDLIEKRVTCLHSRFGAAHPIDEQMGNCEPQRSVEIGSILETTDQASPNVKIRAKRREEIDDVWLESLIHRVGIEIPERRLQMSTPPEYWTPLAG
jgi:hypothetical protein